MQEKRILSGAVYQSFSSVHRSTKIRSQILNPADPIDRSVDFIANGCRSRDENETADG
jgi:hypothetical protein